MLDLGTCHLVFVRCTTIQGRHATRQAEAAICLDCPKTTDPSAAPPTEAPATWQGAACEALDHRRQQVVHTTTTEAAPDEAEIVRDVYSKVYRSFQKIGYPLGRNAYLVADARKAELDTQVATAHAMTVDANAKCKVCYVKFLPVLVRISPTATEEETLASLRRDIEAGIQGLIDALKTGDHRVIVAQVRQARDLAKLVESPITRTAIDDLHGFADRVARSLRNAADDGDTALETAREEARLGAGRFARVFAGLYTPEAGTPNETGGEGIPGEAASTVAAVA